MLNYLCDFSLFDLGHQIWAIFPEAVVCSHYIIKKTRKIVYNILYLNVTNPARLCIIYKIYYTIIFTQLKKQTFYLHFLFIINKHNFINIK